MTDPTRPDWDRIARFYARHHDALMAAADQWGIDPYAWDHEGGISLTPIESALWADIRRCTAVLYPQYPVGRFFVDFGNPAAKVAIECDGAAWHVDAVHDAARQREIEALGWAVYRIDGAACLQDDEEHEDEYGRTRWTRSAARELIDGICDFHGIRMRRSGSGHIEQASSFLREMFKRWPA